MDTDTHRVSVQGLSPRVRGNPAPWPSCFLQERSIPARAGEPGSGLGCGSGVGVYPRACGGTYVIVGAVIGIIGLSPRVRGNPARETFRRTANGSIPARAGEPSDAS